MASSADPIPGASRAASPLGAAMGKAVSGFVLVGLFLLAYLVVNIVHFRYFPVHVVGYGAAQDVLVTVVLFVPVYLLLLRQRLRTTGFESGLLILIGALLATLYAFVVPTVIDRSLSVYILEKLEQRGGAIRHAAVEEMLIREYFPEHRLVDIRLTEALNSGTIVIRDGCVHLTDRGRLIAHWTRLYRTTLLPRHREIMGELTDDLTDPFRRSAPDVSYRCE